MLKNNPLFFIKFLFFVYIQCLLLKLLCFSENTIKIVFSEKKKTHSFSKTQLVKPTFSPMSKKTPFSKKGVIFGFGQFPVETTIFKIAFLVCTVLGPKNFLAKTDSVHENARFFSLPDTNSVRQFLQKIHVFDFFTFLDDHLKKTHIFIGFFDAFSIFFFFFCFYFSNIKKEKQKMQLSFRNLIFDIPKILQKHYFGTM